MRWRDGGAFRREECDLLGEIIPHLKRALNLQNHLTQVDFCHRSMLEALDHLPTGIVVTNGDSQIVHANRAAREIAGRGGRSVPDPGCHWIVTAIGKQGFDAVHSSIGEQRG